MASVYVGNLPYSTTENDLGQFFSSVGQVTNVRVVYDRETGRAKGFGFCEFSNAEDAQSAVDKLNGADFMGRSVMTLYLLSGAKISKVFTDRFHRHFEDERAVENATCIFLDGIKSAVVSQEEKKPKIDIWYTSRLKLKIPNKSSKIDFSYHFGPTIPTTITYNKHVVIWMDSFQGSDGFIKQALTIKPKYLELVSNRPISADERARLLKDHPYVRIQIIGDNKSINTGMIRTQSFLESCSPADRGLAAFGWRKRKSPRDESFKDAKRTPQGDDDMDPEDDGDDSSCDNPDCAENRELLKDRDEEIKLLSDDMAQMKTSLVEAQTKEKNLQNILESAIKEKLDAQHSRDRSHVEFKKLKAHSAALETKLADATAAPGNSAAEAYEVEREARAIADEQVSRLSKELEDMKSKMNADGRVARCDFDKEVKARLAAEKDYEDVREELDKVVQQRKNLEEELKQLKDARSSDISTPRSRTSQAVYNRLA